MKQSIDSDSVFAKNFTRELLIPRVGVHQIHNFYLFIYLYTIVKKLCM